MYEAILKAADHIERHPELWNVMITSVPDCGTPGCALGWIGHFGGLSRGDSIRRLEEIMGASDDEFYNRMYELQENHEGNCPERGQWWSDVPSKAAEVLRLYAEKYHASNSRNRCCRLSRGNPVTKEGSGRG